MRIVTSVFFVLWWVNIYFLYYQFERQSTKMFKRKFIYNGQPNTKTILIWNYFWVNKYFTLFNNSESFEKCEFKNCVIWHREDEEIGVAHEDYNAVLFHGVNKHPPHSPEFVPSVRGPHQIYIYFNLEPPFLHGNSPLYTGKHFFNWTITYRRDSDVFKPHFRFQNKYVTSIEDPDYVTFPYVWREPDFDNVTMPDDVMPNRKLLAWFNSNWDESPSKREIYAWELAKYVSLDIYGKGQQLQCEHQAIECDVMLGETYKFYLAFENSLCKDYVTEKVLRPLSRNVVPIVYGGGNYSSYAPPMSYINVQDFYNPEDLARYLIYLDEHPEEYVKYFWWKKYYKVHKRLDEEAWECGLCRMLNDPNLPKKSYESIDSWWEYKGVCHGPREHFDRGSR